MKLGSQAWDYLASCHACARESPNSRYNCMTFNDSINGLFSKDSFDLVICVHMGVILAVVALKIFIMRCLLGMQKPVLPNQIKKHINDTQTPILFWGRHCLQCSPRASHKGEINVRASVS